MLKPLIALSGWAVPHAGKIVILLAGSLEVEVCGQAVRQIAEGELFGDFEALGGVFAAREVGRDEGGPRTSSSKGGTRKLEMLVLRARSTVWLQCLTAEDLSKVLKKFPQHAESFERVVVQSVATLPSMHHLLGQMKLVTQIRTEAVRNAERRFSRHFYEKVDPEYLATEAELDRFCFFLDLHRERRFGYSGEELLSEGSTSKNPNSSALFLVLKGRVRLSVNNETVGSVQEGELLGELQALGLALGQPATATCDSLCDLVVVHRPVLRQALAECPRIKAFLEKSALNRARAAALMMRETMRERKILRKEQEEIERQESLRGEQKTRITVSGGGGVVPWRDPRESTTRDSSTTLGVVGKTRSVQFGGQLSILPEGADEEEDALFRSSMVSARGSSRDTVARSLSLRKISSGRRRSTRRRTSSSPRRSVSLSFGRSSTIRSYSSSQRPSQYSSSSAYSHLQQNAETLIVDALVSDVVSLAVPVALARVKKLARVKNSPVVLLKEFLLMEGPEADPGELPPDRDLDLFVEEFGDEIVTQELLRSCLSELLHAALDGGGNGDLSPRASSFGDRPAAGGGGRASSVGGLGGGRRGPPLAGLVTERIFVEGEVIPRDVAFLCFQEGAVVEEAVPDSAAGQSRGPRNQGPGSVDSTSTSMTIMTGSLVLGKMSSWGGGGAGSPMPSHDVGTKSMARTAILNQTVLLKNSMASSGFGGFVRATPKEVGPYEGPGPDAVWTVLATHSGSHRSLKARSLCFGFVLHSANYQQLLVDMLLPVVEKWLGRGAVGRVLAQRAGAGGGPTGGGAGGGVLPSSMGGGNQLQVGEKKGAGAPPSTNSNNTVASLLESLPCLKWVPSSARRWIVDAAKELSFQPNELVFDPEDSTV